MTVEIVTSRAIAAQILRHRRFTFQEFSQRYAKSVSFEPVEMRTQYEKNRQASGEVYENERLQKLVSGLIQDSFNAYDRMLSEGVSRETARMVLPLCTQTTLYMTGSVRSWIHYLWQRCAEGTPKEHRDVANSIKQIFTEQFPTVAEAVWKT